MKKSMNLTIVAVLIAVIVLAVPAQGLCSTYSEYAAAFQKTMGASSFAFDTAITAVMDENTTTGTGSMKIRGLDTPNVNFINIFTVGDETFTQFSDGQNVYMEVNGEKRKFGIGQSPEAQGEAQGKEGFSADSYIQEFTALLDASQIRQSGILTLIEERFVRDIKKNGDIYEMAFPSTITAYLLQNLFTAESSLEGDKGINPTASLQDTKYSVTIKDGYLETMVIDVLADVTFPAALTGEEQDATKPVQLTLTLTFVNPGQPVEFELPDTAGYH